MTRVAAPISSARGFRAPSQHVADEIIPLGHARGQALVQAVHDQDDGTLDLVVQPAVEGVIELFVRPGWGL